MASEIIERVARAICLGQCESMHVRSPVCEATCIAKVAGENCRFLIESRAAIEAMREPTEAMLEALTKAEEQGGPVDSEEAWWLMIDAALKDG